MLIVFYSQPFHGRSEEEIFKEREELKTILEKTLDESVEIIDQYHQTGSKLGILANDIHLMNSADNIVVSSKGWMYRGCRVEQNIIKEYNVPCWIYFPDTKELKFCSDSMSQFTLPVIGEILYYRRS